MFIRYKSIIRKDVRKDINQIYKSVIVEIKKIMLKRVKLIVNINHIKVFLQKVYLKMYLNNV